MNREIYNRNTVLAVTHHEASTCGDGSFTVRLLAEATITNSVPLGDQAIRKYVTKILLASGLMVAVIALVAIWHRGGRASGETFSAASANADAAPAGNRTRATASPRSADGTRSLSPQYKVLLVRSLFAADGSGGGAQAAEAPKVIPPSTFSLKGISQEDASYTAFVEDTNSRQMLEVHVGDRLAQGQVSEITLHGLNYLVDNRVVQVAIGQGLDGNPLVASAGKSEGEAKPHDRHNHATVPAEVHVSTLDSRN